MKTAIVILNFNGKNFLEKFLPSVIEYSTLPDVTIIIADNASTDNSVAFLKEFYPQLQLIQLSENFGFAGGYNNALLEVDAEYYVLVNSDVEVSAKWIEPLVEYMDSHPEVAACQPKILSQKNKKVFEYAGASGGFIDNYGYPFCRGRIINECETDLTQYDSIEEIFWATGACLFIRKQDFWDVGGFDESFFAHMEEIDLCWRIKARGRKIVCIPQSIVYHVGGGTLTVEDPKKTYLNYRNNLLMIYKNLPANELQKVLFVRCLFDHLSVIQLFLSGKSANAAAVLKARRDYKKRRELYYHKRMDNLEKTLLNRPSGKLNLCIIYQYFIRNNRTFSQLPK